MRDLKLKVLVVDDDEDDYFLTKELFKEFLHDNIQVDWASIYSKAIAGLYDNSYHIFLVDYLLGAHTGIDFLTEARKANLNKPIIMLTGKGDQQTDFLAMENGAADYLVKNDLDAQKLERSVRYAFERFDHSKKLRESEEKFRRIFEQSRDVIYITDEAGNFLDANDSIKRFLGYTREELLDMNMIELYEDPNKRNLILEAVKEHGEVIDFEKVLIAKDGRKKICLVSAGIHKEPSGKILFQGIIHDITKRRKAEQDLATAEKLAVTGQVVRMIAHEVRNPLTNITLSLEQMESELKDGTDLDIYFDIIKRNLNRINVLITELLNSSKPAELTFNKYSINKIVDDSIKDIEDRIKLKGIKVTKEYSSDLCDVNVDYEKIKIALLNIMVNAIEAVEDDKGELIVATKAEDGKCVVEILDNGVGIPSEIIPNIFDPFFSRKASGTGLGLSTTHHIIRSHKGVIDVTSEPNKGTKFSIKLEIT
ncbi:MAG: PAS domain S-box protein [Bacteroidetes bacterium]|nr:PAS domain S-box protein [Bacteroidota bacterium]